MWLGMCLAEAVHGIPQCSAMSKGFAERLHEVATGDLTIVHSGAEIPGVAPADRAKAQRDMQEVAALIVASIKGTNS